MPRLPPRPTLTWTEAGAPRSEDLGDVYFSGDGLAEKRTVFLDGCGLPEGWAGRDIFNIGELGLGAGLNLLAAWEMWRRHRPSPRARLNFLSFEGWPMTAAEAARVHAAWPELVDLSARLVAAWPDRARGVQRIPLGDGVTLTLHIDDIATALPAAQASIDAWFLDGFAPSVNSGMWSPETLAQVARLSAPDARAATYSVAGEVRRSLIAAGFSVEKRPGHGRKKERLEARLSAQPQAAGPMSPRSVLVVGAGVAGACAARAFLDRGCQVTIVDSASGPGAGASGNPLALVMPRLDAADGPVARGFIAAWLLARRFWPLLGTDAAAALDARHLPRNVTERARFAKLLADPPLETALLDHADADDAGAGVIHRGAVAVRPDMVLPCLLAGADMRWSARVAAIVADNDCARITLDNGERLSADLVIACAGMGGGAISGLVTPALEGRLGQVESLTSDGPPQAIADGGYCVEALGRIVFGATFEPAPDGEPPTTDAARTFNLDILARLRPGIDIAQITPQLVSRAAVRATTQDRLPFAGAAPENDEAPALTPAPSGRIRLIGGLGARGFLWAPLLAELVACEAFGEPLPVERAVREILSPVRFQKRALRRSS